MAKQLTTTSDTYVTVPLDCPAVETILRNAKSFSVRAHGVLQMQNMPNEAERALLVSRQRLLAESMRHDRRAIGGMIAQMLNGFPAAIKENETAEQVVALYVRELGLDPAVPTWAVSLATTAIRLGQAPEISYKTYPRPSTMAVRRVCDGYAWKARVEIQTIYDVLRGRRADPVLTPAQREKVGNFWNDLAAELKALTAGQDAGAGEAVRAADKLRGIIGAEAFAALPDAKKRITMPSAGKVASKVAGGRR